MKQALQGSAIKCYGRSGGGGMEPEVVWTAQSGEGTW